MLTIMNITLRQIQAFKTVAEFGSFTRAAERLKVAQPALSLSIRELERELNLRLFDRTTRRVELTGAGREFLQSADKLLADLDRAVRNARDLSERKRGRIVVAAPPLLAAMIVPGRDRRIQHDLSRHRCRTGRCAQRPDPRQAARGRSRLRHRHVRRARRRHPPRSAGAGCAGAVLRTRLAAREDEAGALARSARPAADHADPRFLSIRALTDARSPPAGIDAGKPLYEVSQMTTAIMLVEAGLGVAVLPAYIWSFARDRDIVSRPLTEPQVIAQHLPDPAGRPLALARGRGLCADACAQQTRAAIATVVTR